MTNTPGDIYDGFFGKAGSRERAILSFFILTFSFGAIASIIYAAHNRTLEDWMAYPLWIALLISIVFVPYFVVHTRKHSPELLQGRGGFAIIQAIPLTVAAYVAALYSFIVVMTDLARWLQHPSRLSTAVVFAVAIGVGILGALLFFMRLKYRLLYGMSETIVGMLVGAHQAYRVQSNLAPLDSALFLGLLTAGVYLVVRGLDNVHTALKTSSNDPFVVAFRNRFGAANPTKEE